VYIAILYGNLMKTPPIRISVRNQELLSNGFGTDYFQGYLNREKRLHCVDVVLLSFVLKGKGVHYLGNRSYPEQGPSLSVTHYGQVHDIVTDKNGMDIINIYLNLNRYPLPEMPAEFREVLHQVLPLHPNFYRTPGHMTRIEFPADSVAKTLVLLMHNELKTKRPGYRSMTKSYFGLFLVECCRRVLEKGLVIRGSGRPKVHEVMEPIRRFLDLHYTEHVSIESLAKRSGYSGSYLCRIFKEYTGKTVYEYILDKRIQTAMVQLQNTGIKISRIAMDSGFTDISFFNKIFKKELQMTPRDYRAQK
jgi:AraC-like DNA-binding protein